MNTITSASNRVAQSIDANAQTADAAEQQGTPAQNTAPNTAAAVPADGTPVPRSNSLPPDSAVPANIARQLGLSPGTAGGAKPGQAPQNDAQPKNAAPQQGTPALVHTSTGVVKGVRQFGPERQMVLGPNDQAALDRYESAITKQQTVIQACHGKNQQAIDTAKQAIAQLNSDIAKDKKSLTEDRGDKQKLAADKKQLAADQKNLAAAKRDLSNATRADAKCPQLKIGISSVPTSAPPTKMASDEQAQAWNQAYGTDINFPKVFGAEGGSYADGYVPWWPDVRTNANGDRVVAVEKKKDGAVIATGYLTNKVKANPGVFGNGSQNSSGVTVGPGVDLGGQKKDAYFKKLTVTNADIKALTPDELQALKNKLSPYMELRRAEAAQYLIAHPLHLDDKEVKLLTGNAVATHVESVKSAYKKINPHGDFTKLNRNQQTILFSEAYQGGSGSSVFKATAKAYGSGNSSYNPPGREHGWINQ